MYVNGHCKNCIKVRTSLFCPLLINYLLNQEDRHKYLCLNATEDFLPLSATSLSMLVFVKITETLKSYLE